MRYRKFLIRDLHFDLSFDCLCPEPSQPGWFVAMIQRVLAGRTPSRMADNGAEISLPALQFLKTRRRPGCGPTQKPNCLMAQLVPEYGLDEFGVYFARLVVKSISSWA